MILKNQAPRDFDLPQYIQAEGPKQLSKKRKQQAKYLSQFEQFSMDIQMEYPPKNFEELKQRIESQICKSMGYLSQANKQKLLKGLDKCNLLRKDSQLFLQNIQSLNTESKQSPEQIQKYLCLETGAQVSSEQRKCIY